MAEQPASRQPAVGAGRPANSEPRIQMFTAFQGINIVDAPENFEYIFSRQPYDQSPSETDTPQTQVVIQNNASLDDRQTIETRQNLVTLFTAPTGRTFTGAATLVNNRLYTAMDNAQIRHGVLGSAMSETVTVTTATGTQAPDMWTFLGNADDQLVGMTANNQLWTGALGASATLRNARHIPDSLVTPLTFAQLTARGALRISETSTGDNVHRVSLRYTLLNRFGPTLASDSLTFFANRPPLEWSGAAFLRINGTVPTGYDVTAVELYFTEGEHQRFNFIDRIDTTGSWTYNWTGYFADVSMQIMGNLTLPNQNVTSGAPASRMRAIDGQLYFWGNAENPQRIWVGGGPGNRFSISTGTGGGFVDCEPGTGTMVRNVLKFKTQQGAAIVTALCDNPNSQREHRYNLVENNIAISNEMSVGGWTAEKIAGTVGTKSFNGATVVGDGLYTISRYGLAVTSGQMEYNSQLRVEYASDNISPVFLDQYGNQLKTAVLFTINDIVYMTFGADVNDTESILDNVIFCYDIDKSAWWTYTLDVDEPILNMIHIDHEGHREGIGIITTRRVYLLPTTKPLDVTVLPRHEVHIETAELSFNQPMHEMQYLSQLEFRFDYFIGDLEIDVVMIDRFGRTIHAFKRLSYGTVQHQLAEYMRIDKTVESYKIIIHGRANMRLTHFLSRNYPVPNRVRSRLGFNSRISHSSTGSIRRYFNSYNDIRKALMPIGDKHEL